MAGISPKKQRKSLDGVFPGVTIARTSSSATGTSGAGAMTKPTMMGSLRETLRCGGAWPCWVKSAGNTKADVNFTIRLAVYLREEFRKHNLVEEPDAIIERAKRTSASRGAKGFEEIWSRIEDEACLVVFGSNWIENAGAGLDITVNLCRRVLRGEPINATKIDVRTSDYSDLVEDFKRRGAQMNEPMAIRTRQEIVQHAQALYWAIDNLVLGVQPWTEAAVKTIHRILYENMGHDEVVPGEYRGIDHPVAAKYVDPTTGKEKTSVFVHPRAVRGCMAAWAQNLNDDIAQAEQGHPVDPYDLAAKHYHHFVNIHPFGDGNGRTSRIILNCLVMKFTGHMIPIGKDDREKDEYLGIANRGSRKFHEEEGEVALNEQKGHREMAKFMARKSVGSLTSMWTWVKKHA